MRRARNAPERRDDVIEQRFYLYPGGIWAEAAAGVITTVLGSCVSVCLWDPGMGVGGINHFVLPVGGSVPSPKYGTHAVPMLIERVLACGARREHLLAAIFGGASVLAGATTTPRLGSRNSDVAIDLVQRAGITVVRQDVGGFLGRKLTFHSSDGATLVRKL